LVCDKCRLILILSNNEHSSSNARTVQNFVKSIVSTTQKYIRIIVQIRNDPLTDFSKVLLFEILDQIIYCDIPKRRKDPRINLTRNGVSLTLVKDSSPVWEVLSNEFSEYFVVVLDAFTCEDFLKSNEETVGNLCSFFSFDPKLNDCASGVEWFKNFIL